MGAAALTARTLRIRPRTGAVAAPAGLAFDELGGPVVAVCGLCGGAGTTTLALLLAREAAAASSAPVLLTEASPHHAGLALATGHATPRSLLALAADLAAGHTPVDTFVEVAPGLRLTASAPSPMPSVEPKAVGELLTQARSAHGLVVIDCATAWTAGDPVLARATHIVWVASATARGLAAAGARLQTAPAPGGRPEILAASATHAKDTVPVRALRRLARERCDQLLLLHHDPALALGELDTPGPAHAITAIAPTLRRNR